MRPNPTRLAVLAIGAAVGLFLAAPALAGNDTVTASGTLVRLASDVPPSARAQVHAAYDPSGGTTVTLRVRGLDPDREYGAHVHVLPCAEGGGPDYQHVPNPQPRKAPHDRAYENRRNEVWLDLHTDPSGRATATAVQPWQFRPGGEPRSVIIHAERTHLGPDGPAGTAGPPLACLTVAF